ncbi:hypothetical protein [Bacillus sp. AG4(2022)]|uniref:hypothetical protein n=1 Tax=Bacillus sp. AG4(2022) TaxID=2962594 RepID=UPI0028810D04|nr:hypothetical protein [Bacillus sp. AG4(2022)]MDT0163561.1 hypothetical protein [Bacillus sp. AG4(2022)]
MLVPATDMGLIATHLSAHDGLIAKIKMHEKKVESEELKYVLNKKLDLLRSHVRLMMEMLDPAKSDFQEVPSLDELPSGNQPVGKVQNASQLDKHIALETKKAAESMALDNFISALKMQDPKVKHAHVQFALQEIEIIKDVTEILKEVGAEITPLGTEEEQQKIMRHFEHILNE